MNDTRRKPISRRSLLSMIGTFAGATAMYDAMTQLGHAQGSGYAGPPKLSGGKAATRIVILGAGIAGMVAAMELRNAGYTVQVLEYNDRAGGRNWTLYGGDSFTELGGTTQQVAFDKNQYLNPGPWRLPYHHRGILHYANLLNVLLEPLPLLNFNAYVHHTDAFGGKPRRFREVQADFHGHVAELLAKCSDQRLLDQAVTKEDQELLFEALRGWGALDSSDRYVKGPASSERRGPLRDVGGGLSSLPSFSEPDGMDEILKARLWRTIGWSQDYEFQTPLFQPKGGMGQIGKAFGAELGPLITYRRKVVDIHQNGNAVTITHVDTNSGQDRTTTEADWCVCTIPATILSQLPMNVGPKMRAAIDHLPYTSAVKTGLQFKRRFWEQDDEIFGGVTYTNQPNAALIYPMSEYFSKGKGVIVGTYVRGAPSFAGAAKTHQERIEDALEYGSKIHAQYRDEFECGVSVAWHRVPWTLGCAGDWTDETRAEHYDNLCALDGRIILAGEHASRLHAWQEGSVMSATDAIVRLHQRIVNA